MTDVGVVRSNNEDCVLLYSLERGERLRPGGSEATTDGKGVVMIVCDGMGGANAGEIASAIAVDKIIEFLSNQSPERPAGRTEQASTLLHKALLYAHNSVLEASQSSDAQEGMGTTATVLWMAQDKAWLGQVGDSRLYRLDENRIEQVSMDQTPVGALFRSGEITADEARAHPQRNLLDQALGGGLEYIEPHCESVSIDAGMGFMLCSDGLSDAITDETIFRIITEDARWSLPTACRYLINTANQEYGQDNVTLALCRVSKTF